MDRQRQVRTAAMLLGACAGADLAVQADYLITMTRSHLLAVAGHFARMAPPPRLVAMACDPRPAIYRSSVADVTALSDLPPVRLSFYEKAGPRRTAVDS